MVVRNNLCKRTIIAYLIFFSTVVLIWRYHEKSVQIEELKDRIPMDIDRRLTISEKSFNEISTIDQTEQSINDLDRLNYWRFNNSKTIGINLTAILAPKRPGKYLVYVCHEYCGGKHIQNDE